MKKLLPISLFTIGSFFFSSSATAQNANVETHQQQENLELTANTELKELLKDVIIPPQPNRAADARKARAAMKETEETKTPYRPKEVITRNEKGELFMKYTYVYDEEGTFYSVGQSLVRDYKIWNKTEQVWDNNMRFRLIIDENGDIEEGFTDLGYRTQWDNHFRARYTYDNNHNQLTACQEQWINNEWYATLKWVNTFDVNGNILTQIYENRPVDGEWTLGSRYTWTYNNAGQVLTNLHEMYSSASGKHSDYLKNVYTYDEKGNMLTWAREQRGEPFFHQTITYDDNNNKISYFEKRWTNGEWVNYLQSVFTYDDQNREIDAIHQQWSGNPTEGAWAYNYKTSFKYYEFVSIQTSYKYDTELQRWVENEQIANTKNAKGQQTNWSRNMWMPKNGVFQTIERDVFTYNADDNMTNKTSEVWSIENQKFTATSIFDYEYDSNMNGTKVMSPRKQAREWVNLYYNHMESEWTSPDFESWIAESSYMDLREYVKATGVTLNKKSHELEIEMNVQLVANVMPENASNKEVYWTSSNPEVARVNVDGRVYGLSEGVATISARTLNGNFTGSCEVKVVKELSSIENISAQASFTYQDQMIRFNGENISKVQVSDVNGRTILRQNNGEEINTSSWDKGMYFIKLSDASGDHTYKLLTY